MNNIKNKIKSMSISITTFMMTLLFRVKSYAVGAGDPTELDDLVDKIKPDISEFLRPICAVLVFFGVITIGINMILKSKKAEDRSNLMWALVTIGIGCFILGSCGLIYDFIMSLYVE